MHFLFGCYVKPLQLQVKRILTHFTQRKKEEKNAVNLVVLTQKQEMRSTYLTW